ncbi:hypothetical protein B0T26DRAFT_736057 [Lasiosphaeria miniovina]|uniref:Aminoglycoside phosphotransferase domain-containing protein n=1 Tax=Lasiosphaeria miniovina TaxID=1954250 RepID=A0AA40BER5_9PEZI|nr:uncharacterized protein B0T26DRAFT_736057 [Lasiosphaeria miniovina]KAK0732916.1 hypothetical protein B0T26DRAFT_736057 [Lasiosphaeria miniovina]
MPATLELDHRGPITLVAHRAAAKELSQVLWDRRTTIEALVRHHLGLAHGDTCTVAPVDRWIRGGFNMCVPVDVVQPRRARRARRARFIFRCPMPHKLAKHTYPGTVGEKLGCEVATYRTHAFYVRLWRTIRRRLGALLGHPILSRYAAHPTPTGLHLPTAYVLLEHIGPDIGRMLSRTRGSSTAIGSFRFWPDGTVTVADRPLVCCVAILEDDGAPRTMPRDETFLTNRNAVYDTADCRSQMTTRAMLRTLSHHYVTRERRRGPFRLQLTDFHASNIFVDNDWNVTCLIDLEWICALPAEMIAVPYWLTGQGIDQLAGDDLAEFDQVCPEFMDVLEEEEAIVAPAPGHPPALAAIMRESWDSGTVWFLRCLTSVNAMISLVDDHISPRFYPLSFRVEDVFSKYWCQDSTQVACGANRVRICC